MNKDPKAELERLRGLISAADVQIMEAIRARRKLEHQVGLLKARHDIAVNDAAVEAKKLVIITIMAIGKGLNFDAMRQIWKIILSDSNFYQEVLVNAARKSQGQQPLPAPAKWHPTLSQRFALWLISLLLEILKPKPLEQ